MAGLLDAHGSGYHPVIAQKGEEGQHGWWNSIWIFAIVIIFFALLLVWRRDERHEPRRDHSWTDGLAPAMLMGAMKQSHEPVVMPSRGYCCDDGGRERREWDIERDAMANAVAQARDAGEIKKEIIETKKESALLSLNQCREADRQASEQQRITLLGFKDTEIQGMKNTQDVMTRIDALERKISEDKLREKDARITQLETILALQSKAPIPAYFPNHGYPCAGV